MKHRKLRIAWSVAWGVVAVVLCVLWVRSYWWVDQILTDVFSARIGVTLMPGAIGAGIRLNPFDAPTSTIGFPAEKWLAVGSYPSRVWGMFRLEAFSVIAPIWCCVILTATLSAAPWLCYFPRRFSLRTLLLATTLVAVVLGLIVWASR